MRNVQSQIDLSKEPAIGMSKAGRHYLYQRDGRASNPSTVYRNCVNGVLRNGKRIHLEHVRQGGRIVTTEKAIERFFERLATDTPDDAPTPSVNRNAHRDAARRLELAGL